MAIKTARIQVNGAWYDLTKNEVSGKWEGTVTAPSATSFHLEGGYYPVTVEAANEAGTRTTVTCTDGVVGPSLRLVVREKVRPTVSVVSPSAGAYLANNQTPVVFQLRDETGGSGVKLSTLAFTLDGTTMGSTAAGLVCTAVAGGYDCVYTPTEVLSDGAHTVGITAEDNDGNVSVGASFGFTIDTVPPVLNLTGMADGLITATAAQVVSGVTNDVTSSSVTVAIVLNGADQGPVSIAADGAFSKSITLAEGENTVAVTSTDRAGKATAVTLTAVLDTTRPVISAVTIAPNPADAGASILLSVEIT